MNTAETTMNTTYEIPIYRICMVRDSSLATSRPQIESSRAASDIARDYIGNTDREHCIVLLLDGKHKVVGLNTVSIGSLNASLVHPREVFKPAIVSQCAAIILAHNHPSGDPQPSREDRELTARIEGAGKLLGIPLLDHLIIGADGRYFSFADQGLIATTP